MDKSKIAIIAATFVAVVAVMAYTYVVTDSGEPEAHDRTGDWYMVHNETMFIDYEDPLNSIILTNDYPLADKVSPLRFDWIEKNMFAGSMSGAPILGGITGDYICFQVNNSEVNAYAYVEGRFFGDALTLSVVIYEDSDMITVSGGSFLKYVHHDSKVIPSTLSAPDFESFDLSNGQGRYYYITPENQINSLPYGANEFEYILCGDSIALMKSEISHQTSEVDKTLYSLCIFRENINGTINCAYAGSSGEVFFGGGLVMAADELHSYIYSRGGNFMTFSTSVFDIDYPYGTISQPTDVSGTWKGTLNYSYGTDIIPGKPVYEKEMFFFEHCFGSVEVVSDSESYVWIGSVYGNGLYIAAEHMGKNYVLFGTVDGDKMTISGFHIDPQGKYMAMQYQLERQP